MIHQSDSITLHPIGVIHSPFTDTKKVPLQAGMNTIEGTIEIYQEFVEGLEDLEGFSHLIIIYYYHCTSQVKKLRVTPYIDNEQHGVFATRAPLRPNNIGFAVVRLIKREKNILTIQGIDMLDQTPVLDLKPFVHEFDCPPMTDLYRNGWMAGKIGRFDTTYSDGRFSQH